MYSILFFSFCCTVRTRRPSHCLRMCVMKATTYWYKKISTYINTGDAVMSIIPRIDDNWPDTVVGKSIPNYK